MERSATSGYISDGSSIIWAGFDYYAAILKSFCADWNKQIEILPSRSQNNFVTNRRFFGSSLIDPARFAPRPINAKARWFDPQGHHRKLQRAAATDTKRWLREHTYTETAQPHIHL